jgi:hypothetical protein
MLSFLTGGAFKYGYRRLPIALEFRQKRMLHRVIRLAPLEAVFAVFSGASPVSLNPSFNTSPHVDAIERHILRRS